MKKFFIAIIALIYLGVSSGITMNVHYCMGKIASTDLSQSKDKCSKCGMKSGAGHCCKDELKLLKLDDAHKLISSQANLFIPVFFINNSYKAYKAGLDSSQSSSSFNNNSPPEFSGCSLNILNCVFRI